MSLPGSAREALEVAAAVADHFDAMCEALEHIVRGEPVPLPLTFLTPANVAAARRCRATLERLNRLDDEKNAS